MSDNFKDIGKRIKHLRVKKDLTLKEVAALADISIGFLGDIESGRTKPSLKTLDKLVSILETSTDYLLGRTDDPHPIQPIWKQEQKPSDVELENFLLKTNIYFDGSPLTDDDKEDLLTYLKVKWERERKKKEKGGEK